MKRLFRNPWFWAVLGLVITNLLLFWKFYFRGLLPFPGDLLVSFFFPWNTGGFPGFNPFTVYKEWNGADAIRQMFPWKSFITDQLKAFSLPLWDPYNFSGYPLLANLQSSVFFPGTILYLILPKLWAWIGQVLVLPIIFGIGVFGFLKSLKLSVKACLFGTIVISNMSYLTVWQEVLVVMQAAIFLPFVLWTVNVYSFSKSKIAFSIVPVLLTLSIFGGHLQTTIYIFMLTLAFALFRRISIKVVLIWILLPLGLAGIQLGPSLEAYQLSARDGEASRLLFPGFILPLKHLVTVIIPDFFGNPATRNFWSDHYGERQVYFGVVALLFALVGVVQRMKEKEIRFFSIVSLTALFLATSPGAYIFQILNIPVLATSMPARMIFLFQFSAGILAAYGFEWWLGNTAVFSRKMLIPIVGLGVVYVGVWTYVLVNRADQYMIVARNNAILPSLAFLATAGAVIVGLKFIRLKTLLMLAIFGVAMLEYGYFFTKYHPFSPEKFFYPSHPVLEFLKNKAGINRFHGDGTSHIDTNFATYYQIYSPEGYDPIYIRRFGEFMTSTRNGKLEKTIQRSDATFDTTDDTGVRTNSFRIKAMDILGVKYLLDKNDVPKDYWDPEVGKFPLDEYEMIWKEFKWKIYERKSVLPRFFLTEDFEVIPEDEKIIDRIYDPQFNPGRTLILEKFPLNLNYGQGSASATLLSYKPNSVEISTFATQDKLLFLSDAYFPGWKAFVDEKETEIYRADYTFRAVAVPKGNHVVKFVYEPDSFELGIIVSVLSLFGLILLTKQGCHPCLKRCHKSFSFSDSRE